jgi:hypothetical protein
MNYELGIWNGLQETNSEFLDPNYQFTSVG